MSSVCTLSIQRQHRSRNLQNRELNEIDADRFIVMQGSVSDLSAMLTTPVDGFVCNILTRIIIHLIPRFKDISGPDTWGISSGIRETELAYLEGHSRTMAGKPRGFPGWMVGVVLRYAGRSSELIAGREKHMCPIQGQRCFEASGRQFG